MLINTKVSTTGTQSLQILVNDWVRRVREAGGQPAENSDTSELDPVSIPADVLSQLSPRKRDKTHIDTGPADGYEKETHQVLNLLAQKVLQLCLADYDPTLLVEYPLYCFALSEKEMQIPDEVVAEIASITPPVLSASNLASLHLADLHVSRRVHKRLRKRTGVYYTRPDLACYIAGQTLIGFDYEDLTVLDPACGGGVFLLAVLDLMIKNQGDQTLEALNKLYGLDLNPNSADLTRLALLLRITELVGPVSSAVFYGLCRRIQAGNALLGDFDNVDFPERAITCTDFISYTGWKKNLETSRYRFNAKLAGLPVFNHKNDGLSLSGLSPFCWQAAWPEVFAQGGFSVVTGNPPYVGFNDYSGVEKAYYKWAYLQVYNLKADLLYYFIYRGVELLKPGGRLGFITSRFWKEASFASNLRQWLSASTTLLAIEDRDREPLFTDAEVDTCLLFVKKEAPDPQNRLAFTFRELTRQVSQRELGNAPWAWLRRIPAETMLAQRLQEMSLKLGEVAQCRTGVQSGLDEVFFVDAGIASKLEPEAIKPAIKNADIQAPGQLAWNSRKYLIYLAPDTEIEKFPLVATYLAPYRSRLEKRLRYQKTFPYYQLQWPRTREVFEVPEKLVTPYKAPRNWFAVDYGQYYFSTDVVSVVFDQDKYWNLESLKTLGTTKLAPGDLERAAVNFLNSRLATWQFRSYSKQVGGGQYDYYANALKQLIFPKASVLLNCPQLFIVGQTEAAINQLVYDLYELTPTEIDLVQR